MAQEADKYYLVKLVKGPVWQPGVSFGLLVLQFKHMRNLWRLQRLKKTVLSGPFSDNGEIRGVVIFKAASADEVRELIERDPAIRAGRLDYQISQF